MTFTSIFSPFLYQVTWGRGSDNIHSSSRSFLRFTDIALGSFCVKKYSTFLPIYPQTPANFTMIIEYGIYGHSPTRKQILISAWKEKVQKVMQSK